MPPEDIRLHEDTDLFLASIRYTERVVGFSSSLIEKDYHCTRVLRYLAQSAVSPLVFKGGTCLGKVHADFFRLSEDLDFSIPTSPASGRQDRRRAAAPLKAAFDDMLRHLGFARKAPFKGANNSSHYGGTLTYRSVVTKEEQTIKVEVGLREPLLLPAESLPARTLLMDPLRRREAVPPVRILALSRLEAYAEKVRAALSREIPAPRDFFDLDYAAAHLGLALDDPAFLRLVEQKLAVDARARIDVSPDRRAALERQLDPELKPVLRPDDFASFELGRIFSQLQALALRLPSRP